MRENTILAFASDWFFALMYDFQTTLNMDYIHAWMEIQRLAKSAGYVLDWNLGFSFTTRSID
jgi:hypothetical protein